MPSPDFALSWLLLDVATVFGAAACLVFVWHWRPPEGLFASTCLTLVAVALWAIGDVWQLLATTPAAHEAGLFVLYTGVIATPAVAWVLALRFAEAQGLAFSWGRRPIAWLPVVLLAISWLGMATNPWTHLFVTPHPEQAGPTRNALWWLNASSIWAATVAVSLLYALLRSRHRSWVVRRKAAMMLSAYLMPFAASVAYVSGLVATPVDFTLVGLLGAMALIMMGIYRTGLFNPLPLAQTGVMDADPVGVALFDTQGHVIYANPSVRALFPSVEWSPRAAVLDELDGLLRPLGSRHRLPVFQDGRGPESPVLCQVEESKRFVRVSSHPLVSKHGHEIGFAVRVPELTELLEARRGEDEAAARFQVLAEQSSDVIVELGADGEIVWASPSLVRVLGRDPWKMVGRNALEVVHEDDVEAANRYFDEVARSTFSTASVLVRCRHRMGAWRRLEISANRYANADGEVGFLCIARDVSERLSMESKLSEARKRESLALLAGGVAHDFNNLMTAILGHAHVVQKQLGGDSPLHAAMSAIESAALQASDLTHALRDYAGDAPVDRELVCVSRVVEETVEVLRSTVRDGVYLVTQFRAGDAACDSHPAGIRQIVMNLVTNALEAVDDGGSVCVRTHTARLDAEDFEGARIGSELEPGVYVLLEVEDDGPGLREEDLDRIFEPFYSTKFVGRGLGLAVVHGVVRSHPAALWVRSTPMGTLFRVAFPLRGELPQGSTLRAPRMHPPSTGTVLVVDDDPEVREVVSSAARQAGLRVLAAGSGREAVRIFLERRDEIRLAIVDLTMPGLAGDRVFRRLREIDPDAKVLLMSGYGRTEQIEDLVEAGLAGFISKPFRVPKLMTVLGELLG